MIGSSPDPNWGFAHQYAYRATVTPYLAPGGNGSYALTNFASGSRDHSDPFVSGSAAPAIEGATLVVIYDSESVIARQTQLVLYDGSVTLCDQPTSVIERADQLLTGFTVPPSIYSARTTFIGADGQSTPGAYSAFNGDRVPVVWDGHDPQAGGSYTAGNLWDTMTVDVSSRIAAGATQARVSTELDLGANGDCVIWVAQVFAIEQRPPEPVGSAMPPPYAVSYYITTKDTDAAIKLGCKQRRDEATYPQALNGIVILHFGSPRKLFTTPEQPTYGVSLAKVPEVGTVSLDEVTAIVVAYAKAYMNPELCDPIITNPRSPQLTIGVGVTNSKIGDNDNPALDFNAGYAWAQMVGKINTTLADAEYADFVQVYGAYDAEGNWSSFTPTLAWAEGYSAARAGVYYSYGSCDSCPREQPHAEWTAAQKQALREAYILAWGVSGAQPLPQIYHGVYAEQWFNVKRYGLDTYGTDMQIRGVLTDCGDTRSCNLQDRSDWRDRGLAELAPAQGWQAMSQTLWARMTPDGTILNPFPLQPLPWLTDIRLEPQ